MKSQIILSIPDDAVPRLHALATALGIETEGKTRARIATELLAKLLELPEPGKRGITNLSREQRVARAQKAGRTLTNKGKQ